MTKDVYEQHRASFGAVSAYVVARGGKRVATIAFKFPRDGAGAGRLLAYVHWLGTEMARGWASGYGYDKRSAACASAAARITSVSRDHEILIPDDATLQVYEAFKAALMADDGLEWHNRLRDAGFDVWQAV